MRRIAIQTAAALGACLVAFSWGIGERGLFESSEARYGSLAAEMVRSGDWLVPRLNGVRRFEKPPLAMWAMASSISLLGESELALRLPGVAAALAAVLAAARLAGGGHRGTVAMLLLAASPLHLGCAKALTTDIYLAALSAVALAFVAEGLERPERRSAAWTAATAAVALGFLTKGPAIWLFTLFPVAAEMLLSRARADLKQLLAPARLAVFAAIAAPWFLLVTWREPGLLGWLVRQRAVGALVSAREFHPGPLTYFVPVALLGFLPASLLLLFHVPELRWQRLPRAERLMLLSVVLPLVVFSFSASKLATYILPAGAPLVALAVRRPRKRGTVVAAGLLTSAIGLLLVLASPQMPWLQDAGPLPGGARTWLAIGIGLVIAAGAVAALVALARPGAALLALASLQAAGLLSIHGAIVAAEERLGSSRALIRQAAALAGPTGPIICYRSFLRGIPYYARRNAVVVTYYRKKRLHPEEWDAVGMESTKRMKELLQRGPAAVVCEEKWVPELLAEVPRLSVVGRGGGHALLAVGER